MRTTFVKLLLAISVTAMIILAATGAYVVAVQSEQESILLPAPAVRTLPSQAPQRKQTGPYTPPPQTLSPDSPGIFGK